MALRAIVLLSVVGISAALAACSAASPSNGPASSFSGTYIPTAGKATAEFAPLVLDDDGTYRFTRANCFGSSGSACLSRGTFAFDGENDLALKDATTGATVHVKVGDIESATTTAAAAMTTASQSLRPLDSAGLVSSAGGNLVDSNGSTTLVTAASSASSNPIRSAWLDGVPMKRVAPAVAPRIFVNLPVGQDVAATASMPATTYASDSATAYDHPGQWAGTLDVTNVIQLWEAEIGFVFANANNLAATVKSRNLRISVETTPLEAYWCKANHGYPATGTLQSREDYIADKTATDVINDFAPIYAAGSVVTFAALDSDGISTVTTSDPGNQCQFTVEQAVQTQIKFMKKVHVTHPEIQFGLLPNFPNYDYNGTLCYVGNQTACNVSFPDRDFTEVIDTQINMIQNNGETVSFVHVDNPYNYIVSDPTVGDVMAVRILPLRDQVVAFGIPFGLIANSELIGVDGAAGDQGFADQTIADAKMMANHGLGSEDDFIVESWFDYPSKILPETTANTFTNVANSAIYEFFGDTGRVYAANSN